MLAFYCCNIPSGLKGLVNQWEIFYHFQCVGNMSLLQVRPHQIQLFTKQRGKDISRPCLFNAVCQASAQDFKSYKLQSVPSK